MSRDISTTKGAAMEEKRIIAICLTIIGCRLNQLGSEKFMGELKAIAEDNEIPDTEMFEVCKLVFNESAENRRKKS